MSPTEAGVLPRRNYNSVTGFFRQADPDSPEISKGFDFAKEHFGLKIRKLGAEDSPDWEEFKKRVEELNSEAKDGEDYKVFFVGRHGQGSGLTGKGEHNVVEAATRPAWTNNIARLDSYLHDGKTMNLIDAHLTELGKEQALNARAAWVSEISQYNMPAPQAFYVSPLDRAIETACLTFGEMPEGILREDKPFKPVIKEFLREVNGVHTCDRRSSRTAISTRWPTFKFESSFAEDDGLWTADHRETDAELEVRFAALLDDVFEHDKDLTYVSFSAHSAALGAILRVIKHPDFRIGTGQVLPLVIRGVIAPGQSS